MYEIRIDWIEDNVPKIRVKSLGNLVSKNGLVFVRETDTFREKGLLIEGVYVYERTYKR